MSKVIKSKIKVEEIKQIAFVVKDIEKTADIWSKTLDIGPWKISTHEIHASKDARSRGKLHGKPTDFSFKAAVARVKDLSVELIQPLEGPSIYKEHLAKKGEGFSFIVSFRGVNTK